VLSKVGVNQLTDDDHRSVQPVDNTHYDSLYEVANRILKNALRFTGIYNHDDMMMIMIMMMILVLMILVTMMIIAAMMNFFKHSYC
jgi:hypothetical protein